MNAKGQRISLEALLGLFIIAIVLVGFLLAAQKATRLNNYDLKVFEHTIDTFKSLEEGRVLEALPFKNSKLGIAVFNYDPTQDYSKLPEQCNDVSCVCLYDNSKRQFKQCETFSKQQFRLATNQGAINFVFANTHLMREYYSGRAVSRFGSQVGELQEINDVPIRLAVSNSFYLGKIKNMYYICATPSSCREEVTAK